MPTDGADLDRFVFAKAACVSKQADGHRLPTGEVSGLQGLPGFHGNDVWFLEVNLEPSESSWGSDKLLLWLRNTTPLSLLIKETDLLCTVLRHCLRRGPAYVCWEHKHYGHGH